MKGPPPDRTASACLQPARSVIIPCFNERRRLPPTLDAVRHYLASGGTSSEIVVVDDGSTDGTAEWVAAEAGRDPSLRTVAYRPNRGKGHAVRRGMLAARGKHLLFMDADGATPVNEADRFWPLLESGRADVVIGSRRASGAHVEVAQRPMRRLASLMYAGLVRGLLLYGVHDTQCGFKAFSAQAAAAIFAEVREASAIFDLEVLVTAVRQGWRISEQPVRWRHDEDSRLTYNARGSLRICGALLRMKARHRLLRPVRVPLVTG